MFHRISGTLPIRPCVAVLCFSVAPLAAQSSVKPLPSAARPPAIAWELASRSARSASPWARAQLEVASADDAQDAGSLFPGTTPPSRSADGSEPLVELGLHASAQASAGFDNGPGDTDVARAGWHALLGWSTGEESGFTVGLYSEASFYGFSDAGTLVPGSSEPLNDVYETSIGSTLVTRASERSAWFTSAALTFAGEDDASFGDSLSLAAVTGLRYDAHRDLSLDVGIAARTLLEDQPWVLPYLGFEWRIDERWRLALEGSEVELAVDLREGWTLSARAAYAVREYRTNDDGSLPGGAMRDHQIDLGGACEWRPSEHARLRLEAGFTAWRELEFFDEDGHRVSESELDAVPYAGLTLDLSF